MVKFISKIIPKRLVPKRFRGSSVVIPHVKLHGQITSSSRGLCLNNMEKALEKAFSNKANKAVAISINSPGGSPVQSALLHDRIRQLASKNDTQVLVFCEDVAASGGYWLATAGDEIYAHSSSIIGSIGVVSGGFGFVEAIKKIGVERRVYTAGKNKAILDPFQPEKKADIERLKSLQLEIHDNFITQVKDRRGDRLIDDDDMFTGLFWTGSKALDMGLIDGLGNMHDILQEKFGQDVEVKTFERHQGLLSKFGLQTKANQISIAGQIGDELIESIESRTLWQRFGL